MRTREKVAYGKDRLRGLGITICAGCQAQTPSAKTESATINGKKVSIAYNIQPANGRKVFGEIVPYGQVWEAGSATLTTEAPLAFDKCTVPPGVYTLFALPEQHYKWQLIVSKKTAKYDKSSELCRAGMSADGGAADRRSPAYEISIIRMASQPVDIGLSLLRMAWLDEEVQVIFVTK
jgi:hypothetical protein